MRRAIPASFIMSRIRPPGACKKMDLFVVKDSFEILQSDRRNIFSRVMLGTPLFMTEFEKPFHLGDSQFLLSDKINGLFETLFETECGLWIMQTCAFFALLRMFAYYFFWQPSVIKHYQDRYAQTWHIGHHLYGTLEKNPLRK